MEANKLATASQTTLGGIVQTLSSPKEFTKHHLLHEVTTFVACNDQVCSESAPCSVQITDPFQSLAVTDDTNF